MKNTNQKLYAILLPKGHMSTCCRTGRIGWIIATNEEAALQNERDIHGVSKVEVIGTYPEAMVATPREFKAAEEILRRKTEGKEEV